jgi:hypothetical protein
VLIVGIIRGIVRRIRQKGIIAVAVAVTVIAIVIVKMVTRTLGGGNDYS